MTDLPLVGAATKSQRLESILSWILEDNRDLEIQDPCRSSFLDSNWTSTAETLRAQLDGYSGRLGVHGAYDGIYLASGDPLVRQLAQKRLSQSLDFAAEIGAAQCVIHSPFLFLGSNIACHSACLDLDVTIERTEETLRPLLERARDAQCVLVIENIFDRSPTPLRMLVETIGHPFLKRSIDTGHAAIAERTANGPSPEFWIQEAGNLLSHVHLQDTNGEYDYHWTLGDGSLNWQGIFKTLQNSNAQPHLIIETPDPFEGWRFLRDSGLAR